MLTIIGTLGAICLALSGLPQLIRCIKTKNVEGISIITLSLIFLGCFMLLIYASITHGFTLIVLNYIVNSLISFLNIIFYLKYKK
jgi:MtN3 and saliva related transmembrane protein